MRLNKKWRIGYDNAKGKRVRIEGDNATDAVFDEIVLGDWLHIEMMSDKPECYWMRLGERVFSIYAEKGTRTIREDTSDFKAGAK